MCTSPGCRPFGPHGSEEQVSNIGPLRRGAGNAKTTQVPEFPWRCSQSTETPQAVTSLMSGASGLLIYFLNLHLGVSGQSFLPTFYELSTAFAVDIL